MEVTNKPHVVCAPVPAQGHINSAFRLARLLHYRGIYITFVLTEFDFARLTTSMGSDTSILNLKDFRFETMPDGLPPDNKRGVNDVPELCRSLVGEGKKAFKSLLERLLASTDVPPVTCVMSDVHFICTREACQEFGIRVLLFCTTGACSELGFLHYEELVQRGLFPMKDEKCLTNGFLDTPVDWIEGLMEGATLKHLPSFLRSTDADDAVFNYFVESARYDLNAASIIFNTFDDLEGEVIEKGIKCKIPNVCTIGPITMLCQQANLQNLGSNLWKEDANCLEWLDKWSDKSVIYVNYGSFTILTPQQLEEFAWGLANTKHPFLWVVRNDLVNGESGFTSEEYMEEIKDRGFISGWCPQEKVLKHPSVAAFLTHCGWNSTLESLGEGVPMICWPFFADQQTNCWYACKKWGIGLELGEDDVDRKKVKNVVREIMDGEKGKEIKENAREWKIKAEKAIRPGGSSHSNFDNLVASLMEMKLSS